MTNLISKFSEPQIGCREHNNDVPTFRRNFHGDCAPLPTVVEAILDESQNEPECYEPHTVPSWGRIRGRGIQRDRVSHWL
jgi:hypothetical protein